TPLSAGARSDAILVPQLGATPNPRGQAVAMVAHDQDQGEQRIIQPNRTVGNRWLVSDGRKVGDRLITEGPHMVQPGMQVEPVPAANVDAATGTAATSGQEG